MAPIKHDSGARGTASTRGGQGAAHAAMSRPSVNVWAIDTASATPTQQQQRPNAIPVPGRGRQAWERRGAKVCLRRNAEAICRCVGHQHSLCHSSSVTAATERKRGARGATCAGGGKRGCLRCNAADTTRLCADHQRGVEKYIKRLTWQWGQAVEDMLAMTDDPWLRLRMVVVVVCQEVRATLW